MLNAQGILPLWPNMVLSIETTLDAVGNSMRAPFSVVVPGIGAADRLYSCFSKAEVLDFVFPEPGHSPLPPRLRLARPDQPGLKEEIDCIDIESFERASATSLMRCGRLSTSPNPSATVGSSLNPSFVAIATWNGTSAPIPPHFVALVIAVTR